jgi:hypothetical protein
LKEVAVQINLSNVLVDDQGKALKFYTEVLGFVKKADIPMGEFRWLTVASPEGPAGVELVLEPTSFPPAKTFQKALFEAGIPLTAFISKDIQKEYESDYGCSLRGHLWQPHQFGSANRSVWVLCQRLCIRLNVEGSNVKPKTRSLAGSPKVVSP